MSKREEKILQAKIVERLEKNGYLVIFLQGSGLTKAGYPDLLAIKNNNYETIVLGIEVKTKTGKLSKVQELTIKNWDEKYNINIIIARDIKDLDYFLND